MKKVLALALSIFLMVGSLGAASPKGIESTHHIVSETLLDSASCSATAIGKHTLLTASHCELPTDTIEVDGYEAKIVGIARDGYDHSILYLDGIEFKDLAEWTKTRPQIGDEVHIMGNPGRLEGIYRKGTLAKEYQQSNGMTVDLWDINSFFGDSGSAMFDSSGRIVAVLSFGRCQASGPVTMCLAGSFQMGFTEKDFKDARDFGK